MPILPMRTPRPGKFSSQSVVESGLAPRPLGASALAPQTVWRKVSLGALFGGPQQIMRPVSSTNAKHFDAERNLSIVCRYFTALVPGKKGQTPKQNSFPENRWGMVDPPAGLT